MKTLKIIGIVLLSVLVVGLSAGLLIKSNSSSGSSSVRSGNVNTSNSSGINTSDSSGETPSDSGDTSLADYIQIDSFTFNISNSADFPAAGIGSNNPTFDVTATLDSDHATGTDYVGFRLGSDDYALLVGYNKDTGMIRVMVDDNYREYYIVYGLNRYDQNGANTFRLTYNGGATLRLYINGEEAKLVTEGEGAGFVVDGVGTINLRYNFNAVISNGNADVQAWHGFAGSNVSADTVGTLYIRTFGDGMSRPAFTE